MKNKVLLLILLLAALLRLYKLDSYPSFNADEAAIGYNTYSLIETGKDEHGNPWPIHFQSFNDFKPGGYFYLVLPFVKVFGLNEWSIRLPNALLAIASVYVLYLLVLKIFGNKKLALISALGLSVSPWHLHFSRGGWEVSTATFFILLGVYLFLRFLEKKKLAFLAISIFSLVLSMYTYHAARIIIPLLVLGITIIYWKDLELKKNMKNYILAVLFFILLLLPLVKDFMKPEAISRAAGVGLFADPGPISRIEEQRTEHGDFTGILPKVMHNRLVNYGLAFMENWADHYHGLFLFLSGDDIERNKVPETGQMYAIELLFVIVGLFSLIKVSNKGVKLIIWWLIIAPTAAALTFQSPHALRAQNMVIPLVIISSFGITTIFEWLDKNKYKWGKWGLLLVMVLSFARYEHMYWKHMSSEYPYSSQYGVRELVNYVNDTSNNFRKVLVTDRYDQPYILFLYYLKYPPELFQKNHNLTPRDGYGFSTVNHFDKYYFTAIRYDEARPDNPNSLIVGTPDNIPDEANIVKEIYGTNGYKYFEVVAN